MGDVTVKEELCVGSTSEDHEATCWGCGLRLLLMAYTPTFKCGWCGAITQHDQTTRKPDSKCFSQWRRFRDWFLVIILFFFMLLVICAGIWAIYPIVFSISFFCGVFHCTIAAILSVVTLSTYCLASFQNPGAPANILWGSYPIVGKNGLENYTFCVYCTKPKPPRAHHCRSCKMCVMDMDHHCPFIGNCVGAANHRAFVAFLISVVTSCTYITLMTIYGSFHIWPPVELGGLRLSSFNDLGAMKVVKESIVAFASSALFLSARGLVLIYLAFASLSVDIGIGVLLWQQLSFIYEGSTYINQLSSPNVHGERRGWKNLVRFFGCPYSVSRMLLGHSNAGKLQDISSSKLL